MCKFFIKSTKTLVECPKAMVFTAEGCIENRFGDVLVSILSLRALLNRRTRKHAHGIKEQKLLSQSAKNFGSKLV